MLYPAHFFLFSGSFRFRCLFCAFLFFQGLVNLLYDLLGLLILRRSVELLVERLRKLLCLVIFLLFKWFLTLTRRFSLPFSYSSTFAESSNASAFNRVFSDSSA